MATKNKPDLKINLYKRVYCIDITEMLYYWIIIISFFLIFLNSEISEKVGIFCNFFLHTSNLWLWYFKCYKLTKLQYILLLKTKKNLKNLKIIKNENTENSETSSSELHKLYKKNFSITSHYQQSWALSQRY